ncbi:MAG TPA: NADH-quinone oxidoreductase subunit NuoF [Candidatus Atribacteria bacterium]|nr:NADH-quinone oxidoreductase subunit NuoF [Candidatus Atribacteria bacterium]
MYNFRTHILLCYGGACISSGSESVKEAMEEEITKAELQNEVEIVTTGCMGTCELGPIMVVYPEGIFYQKVKPEDAKEIVQEHLLKGRVVKRLFYKKPKTEEMVEVFNNIDFFKLQRKIALRNCGIINPLNIEEYIAADGYMAIGKVLTEMTPQQVVEEVKKSGLRGRGGAGFPTGLKWQFTAAAKSDRKYVLCNADEGDPGAFMDRSILEGDPHSVMEAMMICGYAIGSVQGYIYVRAEYPLAIERLSIAIKQARENKLLGKNILGTGFNFDIELRMGAGAFVCGEETALMRSIEGKRGQPRPKPPYPAQKGLFELPTVLNNVETYANIPYIILKGAEDYASVGTEKSKGTKVFALAGDINNTGLIEIPIGMPLGTIIYDIGGGIPNNKKLKAVQIGGPSGGCIPADHLNVRVDYESLKELGAIMGSGGLIVMDEDTCMVDLARYFMEFIQEESCGKCTPCREGTRIMLEILTRICQGKGKMKDLDTLEELSYQIKDTALCGLGQTAPNPILSTLRYFKDEYIEHIRDKKCRAGVCAELVYAPCSNACPASVNVPAYLAYTKEGQIKKALQIHLKNNPFPAVCGRVCPHKCEAKCRRNDLDAAVNIRSVKRFMADSVDDYLECFPEKQNSNGIKVAVIGSGPSGLSNAYFLTMLGYDVTVFESESKAGGMLTYAIPSYRLPKDIVEKEIQALSRYGVKIKTNTKIGKDITIDELKKQGFKAFYIAVGTGDSIMPVIEGADGNNRVISGLDFLYKINNNEKISVGQEVVVIGGGNTAIDAARTAKRMGANVTIVYRRTREEMPAEIEEIKEAENEGIKIQLLQNIKSIKSTSSNKLAVEFFDMRLSEFDKSGRRRPVEIEASSFVREIDLLILAIGQKPALNGLFDKELIKLNRNGTIFCSSHKGETMSEDIFAGGDVVTGPSTVVEAIGQAQKAAEAIDKYLTDGQEEYPWNIMDEIEVKFDPEEEPVDYERAKNILLPIEKRDSYTEVEKTWDKITACKEAERCLRCEYKKEEEGS